MFCHRVVETPLENECNEYDLVFPALSTIFHSRISGFLQCHADHCCSVELMDRRAHACVSGINLSIFIRETGTVVRQIALTAKYCRLVNVDPVNSGFGVSDISVVAGDHSAKPNASL